MTIPVFSISALFSFFALSLVSSLSCPCLLPILSYICSLQPQILAASWLQCPDQFPVSFCHTYCVQYVQSIYLLHRNPFLVQSCGRNWLRGRQYPLMCHTQPRQGTNLALHGAKQWEDIPPPPPPTLCGERSINIYIKKTIFLLHPFFSKWKPKDIFFRTLVIFTFTLF